MNYFAVIVAAGKSTRMNAQVPKPYLPLLNKTVIEWTLHAFLASSLIKKVVVVIAQEDHHWSSLKVSQHPKIVTVIGGAERMDSCINGLEALKDIAQDDDWVLEHDAARPCLSTEALEKMLAELSKEKIGGLLAVPASDTLKRSDPNQYTIETVDRKNVWHALTPQGFRYGLFFKALTMAKQQGTIVTDGAQAIEMCGYQPRLFLGSKQNIKITTAEDLALAEFYLKREC
jgi:2-C-methyl-D-erythritol 4-phosphate cytidylyltransferase